MLALWDRIRHLFSGPQLPWMIVWLGLATLIVGLIVLTRTKWGQSHPLRKCAALSLLVHLLLAAYATTVQIVTVGTPDGNSDRGTISVTLVDDQSFIPATAEPSKTSPKSAAAEPIWNQLLPGAAAVPTTLAMTRPDTAAEPTQPEPKLQRELAEPVKPLLEKPSAAPPEMPHAERTADAAHVPAAKPATPIDAPAPTRPQPETAATAPAPASIERQSLTAPDSASPSGQHSGPKGGTPEGALVGRALHVQSPGANALITPAELPAVGDQAGSDSKTLLPAPAALVPLSPMAAVQNVSGSSAGSSAKIGPAPLDRQSITDGVSDANSPPAHSASNGAKSPGPASTLVVLPAASNSAAVGNPGHTTASPVPAPDIYKDRTATDRAAILKRRGGSPETEAAVQAALRWLVAHQEADGHWDAEKNGAGRELTVLGHDRSGAGAKAHTATTALALLALLGSGNTHRDGPYARNVQRGLEYLLSVQGRDGNLGGQAEMFAFMYSHGMATFAMSEDYAMTHDQRLEQPLRAAIGYTIAAQHPTTGGWRYQAHETGDTSQLGWQLMAPEERRAGRAADAQQHPRGRDPISQERQLRGQ